MIIWRHDMLLFKIHVSVLVQALQGGWRNYTPFGHKKWRIKTRFFRWYDGEMMIAINCNWIQISIVSWIRDILVRIRIRRYVPLTYGSEFILGSGSGFESGFRYRIQGSEKHRIRICYTAFWMYFYFFCLFMEGSGSGCRSRSGSEQMMTDPDPGGSS
jgi:hypothetical protein